MHHPTTPSPWRHGLAAVALLLLGLGTARADTATLEIANGRAALAAHNLNAAVTAFNAAVTLDGTNGEARVLRALTSLVQIETLPDAQALLNGLGVSVSATGHLADRNIFHWKAKAPKHFASKLTSDNFKTWGNARLLIVLQNADADLAVVTDSSFQLPLGLTETGLPDVTLDIADLLMVRSMLNSAICAIQAADCFNTNVALGTIGTWLSTNAMTMQKLLATYPNLLTLTTPSGVSAMAASFNQAVNLYVSAVNALAARTDNTERLFSIDPQSAPIEAKLRAEVLTVQASLQGQTTYDTRTQVNAGAYVASPAGLRSVLPKYVNNHDTHGTFPDVKFDGVLPTTDVPGQTARVEGYFDKLAHRLDRLFKHRDDPLPPTLRVLSPVLGARVLYTGVDTVDISGIAGDNLGVVDVTVFPQDGPAVAHHLHATLTAGAKVGTVNWKFTGVPVVPGLNTFSIFAYDAQGNASRETIEAFTFVKLASYQQTVDGSGLIRSTVPATHQVELAKLYQFAGVPAPNNYLTHWTVDVGDGSGPHENGSLILSATPEGPLSVTAHFAPIPYVTRAGVFNGVIYLSDFDPITFNFTIGRRAFSRSR